MSDEKKDQDLLQESSQGALIPEVQMAPTVTLLDLNRSNPFADFSSLLLKPRLYFLSVFELLESQSSSRFFWGKVLFSFFFLQWISVLANLSGPSEIHVDFNVSGDASKALELLPFFSELAHSPELSWFQDQLRVLPFLWKQAMVFLLPFFELTMAASFALVASWGLKFFSDSKRSYSFASLFFVALVARYFAVMGFLPVVGGFASWLLSVLYFLFGVRLLSGFGWAKAFFATYIFSAVLTTLMFLGLGVVFMLFALIGGFLFA